MIVVISPSKKMDESAYAGSAELTQPYFSGQSQELADILHAYTAADIKALMGVSDAIAELNVKRFQSFSMPFTKDNAKPALYLFKGDVYDAMDVAEYGTKELSFATGHLRVLSGLYGLLRPLDLMQPYRLEMGKKLANEQGKDLYSFWGDQITDRLNEELEESGSRTLINLASNEYFKSVRTKKLAGEVVTLHFKEEKDGQHKIVGIFAKRARGMMADYIIKNEITEPEVLKSFTCGGYSYNKELSTPNNIVFSRKNVAKKAA